MWVFKNKQKPWGKKDNRKYFGVTKREPTDRWGHQGCQYKNSPYFYNAIQKYGWDNFEHTVLYRDLTSEDANKKEIELIEKYNTREKMNK